MPILFNRVLTFAAVPFLALFGFAFLCVRTVLSVCMRLAGWKLVWPPVLVDGLIDPDDQPRLIPPGSSIAPSLPRTTMTRVEFPRL